MARFTSQDAFRLRKLSLPRHRHLSVTKRHKSKKLLFAAAFSCANLCSGMISIATKRITSTTSMSITSTKAKKTIFASGAWRNS